MKKLLFILMTMGLLSSCSSDDGEFNSDSELVGTWKLIEVLADPGDGSGVFIAVESEKTITFQRVGAIFSNGTLCDLSIHTNNRTSGIYSASESTFKSPDCFNPDYNYRFERNENILIIYYPCIESCQAKYRKV